ncbi:MAG: radical SAM protein with 4Fe4S-binding SPASM domain [Myxococcota bacterium]|jgi:radical SAM protein with 4Fe4S-binding SPASM domain
MSFDISEYYVEKSHLMTLHLDVLYACDLDCHHCYLDDKKKGQVATPKLLSIIQEAADLGAMKLLLSGGEVFLRKDLFEIIEFARSLKFRVDLKTHGGHIGVEHAKRLAELGVSRVDMSIYALDDEVHDTFTKVPGSLKRTLAAVDYLLAEGITVGTNCVISKFNLHHYRELRDHFVAKGCKVGLDHRIFHDQSEGLEILNLNVSEEDKARITIFSIDRADGNIGLPKLQAPEKTRPCNSGRAVVYVAPDLEVYGCPVLRVKAGDLHTQTLTEVWRESEAFGDIRELRWPTVCGPCAARPFCAYCYGISKAQTGDLNTPPPLVCNDSFAKLDGAERYLNGERPQAHVGPKFEERQRKATFEIKTAHAPVSSSCCG